MVRELLSADASLVLGTEPATTPIGHLDRTQDPWVAFARLRRYADDFVRATDAIRGRPRRMLRVRRESVSLNRVRRIDRYTAASLLKGPAASLVAPVETRASVRDAQVNVPSMEESVDSAANRAMLAMMRAMAGRSRELLRCLPSEIANEPESETRTPLAVRWPRRRQFLDSLSARLDRLCRRPPFDRVTRAEITAAGLTSIASDPAYSRAWNRGWRALRHGTDAADASDSAWLSPSWQVYERWCFLRMGKQLRDTYPTWNWELRREPHRWVGASGDRRAELLLQPRFRNSKAEKAGAWSISKEREPDIVLIVRGEAKTRFCVFDAKYRASREAVLDAMESAHIYHDALRVGARAPEVAVLLVPTVEDVPWLAESPFVDIHRVGVHAWAPQDAQALPLVIGELLK